MRHYVPEPGCRRRGRSLRLESLAHRSRSAPAIARRARIIVACAEGTDSKLVAQRLHLTPGTVCKWRGRFIKDRLDGPDNFGRVLIQQGALTPAPQENT